MYNTIQDLLDLFKATPNTLSGLLYNVHHLASHDAVHLAQIARQLRGN